MKLSVIVPCYNEENNIYPFYEALVQIFKDIYFDYEIIFINDGSKDKTLSELKKLFSRDNEHIHIIHFSL